MKRHKREEEEEEKGRGAEHRMSQARGPGKWRMPWRAATRERRCAAQARRGRDTSVSPFDPTPRLPAAGGGQDRIHLHQAQGRHALRHPCCTVLPAACTRCDCVHAICAARVHSPRALITACTAIRGEIALPLLVVPRNRLAKARGCIPHVDRLHRSILRASGEAQGAGVRYGCST